MTSLGTSTASLAGVSGWYRNRFAIAIAAVILLALSSLLRAGDRWPLGRTVAFDSPTPEGGHAYVATLARPDLSGEKEPIDSFLFEIQTDRGLPAFKSLNKYWGWSLTYLNLRARLLAKNPNVAIDRRVLIGPGNTHHEDIRGSGGGRYSIWRGALHFSASDNSSPLTNGRRYELFVPYFRLDHLAVAGGWLRALAVLLLIATILRALAEHRVVGRVLANTVPGVFVTAMMLAVAVAGFEIYQRVANTAFQDEPWPMRFHPTAGLVFQPGAEIKWSNQLDFWTREHTNSLGFLDREPDQPKPAGRFRILLVGDSFIEASQVTIAEKVQTRLAARLDASFGQGATDVVALGLSGTGQANQLAFYETFGKQLTPDLVILLAVSNDFADNSPFLSAMRNGWSPSRPPWFYFERDGPGFKSLTPAEDWARFRLTGNDPVAFHASLIQDQAHASRLAGWGGPRDTDIDTMFWRRELPPAFQDAIDLTRRALDEWKAVAVRDGFKLTVVATSNLTRGDVDGRSDGRLYLERFRAATGQAGLPLLDLYPVFARQPDLSRGSWPHDQHWNSVGHQWAADALFRYLNESGLIPAAIPQASVR